jgi:CubicO group peptidase (beta-lactamase class C family)
MRRLAAAVLVFCLVFPAGAFPQAAKKPAAAAPAAKTTPEKAPLDLAGFDAFVEQTMKEWDVPGAAVAIVRDGKVVLAKGYGWRDVENKQPVTPRTLFAIGSITKSFTVAALASLVDAGKVEWDKPVREYLPDFRMHDPMATERLTPRDMVTHRSGLPRHDALWYNSTFTRKELVHRLRYLEPSKDLRQLFQYNNLMYLTAGYLTGELMGTTWEDAVRKNIFAPLEMKRTNFTVTESQKSDDFAMPYERGKVEGKDVVKKIGFRGLDEMAPAGSINSSVEEMANYLTMYLSGGKFGDKQVLSAANITDMTTPQMVIPGALLFPEVGHSAYGMGLFVTSYRGRKLVHHGGNIDGFSALMAFLPQEKTGVVVLTNMSGTPVPSFVTYNVWDRVLGLGQVGWSKRFLDRRAQSEAAEEEAKKQGLTPRKAGTRPSHDVAEFVGEYEHPGYGVVRIEPGNPEPGELKITYNRFTSPLKHFHYDVFEVPPDPFDRLQRTKVLFHTGVNGEVSGLYIAMQPDVKDIFFTRRAASNMRERAFLEQLIGEYQLGPTPVTVALRGDDTITLTVPGQPTYELAPVSGMKFNLKAIAGFSLEFRKDEAGRVKDVVFYQPNGTFVAKRK